MQAKHYSSEAAGPHFDIAMLKTVLFCGGYFSSANLTLLIDKSRQLECSVVNRYTRLVVTLRFVVTPATNILGAAISLDDTRYRWVERTGKILLPHRLIGSVG